VAVGVSTGLLARIGDKAIDEWQVDDVTAFSFLH